MSSSTSDPAAKTAAAEAKDRSAFTRYKVMAIITAVMLLLLCLEMVLKYVFQLSGVDAQGRSNAVIGAWVPFIHGWIYVIYLITVFDMWSRMKWSVGRILALVAGGVVPLLSFFMEARAKTWFETSVSERRA